ncbi:hypothetical protein R3P38DRAFT_333001 [Favolaschia claudopus]|uniref:Uncharacterized protein n=1 Tax=Favolaschia claudopus TaxID=2862362 RepID=A0AAV9ZMH3_9AGAR
MLGGLWHSFARLPQAQAHLNWNSFPGSVITINGGTGGAGGASVFQGGAGGNGEGPQFHLPAVTTWNKVEGDVYYSSFHYYCCTCNCDCGDFPPNPTADVVMEGRIVRIVRKVRRVAKFMHGNEEITIALVSCTLYSLLPPSSSKHPLPPRNPWNASDRLIGNDLDPTTGPWYLGGLYGKIPTNFLALILRHFDGYMKGNREGFLFVVGCCAFAINFPGPLKLTDRLRLVPLIALPYLVIPRIFSLNDTITLVNIMGERRHILLAVWLAPRVQTI